jgi:hypothetical protein
VLAIVILVALVAAALLIVCGLVPDGFAREFQVWLQRTGHALDVGG